MRSPTENRHVDVTSNEIRSSRFQGTRHVYDRREIDAFLHRTAATLEMYERKLTVTEAQVESLEKALDLAQSRARSIENREDRIAELEAAVAAAQHNYESTLAAMESRGDDSDVLAAERLAEAERQAEEILIAAHREAGRVKAEAERLHLDAGDAANSTLAAAQNEAEEILHTALLAQTAVLEEADEAKSAAEAAIQEEIDALGAGAMAKDDEAGDEALRQEAAAATEALLKAQADLAAAGEETAALAAAAESEMAALTEEAAVTVAAAEQALADAQKRAAEAEERADAVELERSELAATLERVARESEADKAKAVAEVEQAAEDMIAQITADRDEVIAVTRSQVESEVEAAAAAIAADNAAATSAEVESLQRQISQMRTALANIQQRFANAAKLSPQEMELAAALVDLDLHDVDQLVDLTSAAPVVDVGRGSPDAGAADTALPETPDEASRVAIKSKWRQAESVPQGSWRTAAQDRAPVPRGVWPEIEDDPANGRDTTPPVRPERRKPAQDADESTGLGFYERRLAGLRERIQDAKADGPAPE